MTTRPSDPDGWYDPDKPAPTGLSFAQKLQARIAEMEAELARRAAVIHTNSERIAELEGDLERTKENFGAFYRSGVLAEREACAQMAFGYKDDHPCLGKTGRHIATAIRARPAP